MNNISQKVAIQGINGSYHGIAARNFFEGKRTVELIDCNTFRDVIDTVKNIPTAAGVIAIENTIAGSLLNNHELIRASGLMVVGEYKLRISHCLATLPGTTLEQIEEISSHPMALMQCESFLEKLPHVRIVERDDTATSARLVLQNQSKGHAAICGTEAAKIYGLQIIAESIESNKHNFTRFLIIMPNKLAESFEREKNKASLVFTLHHSVGSLSQILTVLSFYGMNLTKIQSCPLIGTAWEYLFYVDLTFKDYARYQRALDAVLPLAGDLKILGEYHESTT
ncbi:MAG: prephenate dehydratase [Planctomycetaceae bacterium]|jgi:prephenate dehydratase|nr:prephenate dehydratase [Planctomycetaceae bacterium]